MTILYRRTAVATLVAGLTLGLPLAAHAVETTAPTRIEEAATARADGELETAVIVLKSQLRDTPDNLPARLMLGEIYLQQGMPLAAQKELEVARSLGGNDERINIGIAKAYIMQAKFPDAIREIGDAAKAGDTLDTMLTRAQALIGLDRLDDAIAAYRQALEVAPQSEPARIGLGRAYIQSGNWSEASEQFDQVLSANPAAIDAWIASGELAQAQGDLETAANAYTTAMDLSPDSMQIHLFRAAVHLDLDKLDAALKDVEYVLDRVDYEPQALHLKSQILVRQGHPDEARDVMQEAVDLLNNADQDMLASFPSMLRLAGVSNAAMGQNLRAIDFFDKYLTRYPNDVVSLRWRATLALRMDQPADAVPYLRRLLENAESDVAALNLMGIAQVRLQRFDLALPYFQKAAELAPENADVSRGVGGSYMSLGDMEGAISALSEAVSRDPNNLSSVIMLVLAHIRDNNPQAARGTLEEAAVQWSDTAIIEQLAAAVEVADSNFEGARDHLKAALDISPDFMPARLALARIELQTQQLDQAETLYKDVLSDDKGNLAAIEGLAQTAMARRDYADAAKRYGQAREIEPGNSRFVRNLMTALVREGDVRGAEAVADAFLRGTPGSVPVLAAYADILNTSGRAGQTIGLYRNAITTSTADPNYYIGLARAQVLSGDTGSAMETFLRATKAFPVSTRLYSAYIDTALRTGDIGQARDAADALLARLPGNEEALELKGKVLMTAGKHQEAYDFFQSVPNADSNGAAVVGLFKAAMTLGHGETELPNLIQWVRTHPGDTNAKAVLAGAYQVYGHTEAAIREYEGLRLHLPQNPSLLNNLAWLYYVTGNDRALETAGLAYELAPDNANTADTYGWILVESGNAEAALPLLRKARSLDASAAIIQFHTGVALHALGRDDEARRELEAAVSAPRSFEGIERARELLEQIASAKQ